MTLLFPSAGDLLLWIEIAQRNSNLEAYLPVIDDVWVSTIESDLALCAMHPDGRNIFATSARLFHRVIKNHHFVDGNKRSALLILYIFLDMNRAELRIGWRQLYRLAKEIASTKQDPETVIIDLAARFAKIIIFVQE